MNKLIVISLILVMCGCGAASLPEASVTVLVLDEDGKPIEGATAGVGFTGNKPTDPGTYTFGRSGLTDSNGKFTTTAKAAPWITYDAEKKGYYRTGDIPYIFTDIDKQDRLVPWNPTLSLVLKKIANPVPMYVRKVTIQFPVANKPVGYDLELADWVAPYGKGVSADFLFLRERRSADSKGPLVRLTLMFSNEGDGILPVQAELRHGSRLALPRIAPEAGYQKNWVLFEDKTLTTKYSTEVEGRSFVYRIRSQTANGGMQNAIYGKIRGDFEILRPDEERPGIGFVYYLNPDGSRNLEFDPKKNLVQGLKSYEKIMNP